MSSALCALWEGFLEEEEAERQRSFFGSPLGGTEGLRRKVPYNRVAKHHSLLASGSGVQFPYTSLTGSLIM